MKIKKLVLFNEIPGKILFFIIVFLVLIFLGIMIGGMLHFKKTNGLILRGDLTCEFREEVYINDFILELDGTLLENYRVDTSEVGNKTLVVQFKNRYGFVEVKKFQIEIKDITKPTVIVNNPLIWERGNNKLLLDVVFCADDYDDDVLCEIKGEYDLNKLGEYPLNIKAVDASGNVEQKDFILKVIDKVKESTNNISEKVKTTNFKTVYKKYKTSDTMVGVDLSKWQGDVNFAKIKEQGVEFVMLKVAGQTKIGGEINLDPKFYDNIEGAIENGLQVGVYFYSYARSEVDARKQARFVVEALKDYSINLPIVFDWENWNSFSTFKISFNTLNKIAKEFMKEVERNGYDSMLYSSKYYLETVWYHEEFNNWLAYYTNNNNYSAKYLMWQLCNNGRIDGIDGNVDIDILYLNK